MIIILSVTVKVQSTKKVSPEENQDLALLESVFKNDFDLILIEDVYNKTRDLNKAQYELIKMEREKREEKFETALHRENTLLEKLVKDFKRDKINCRRAINGAVDILKQQYSAETGTPLENVLRENIVYFMYEQLAALVKENIEKYPVEEKYTQSITSIRTEFRERLDSRQKFLGIKRPYK